ncbi:non-canonical purine NTP pyrophosphatase [Flavobacterium branchiophilum NBRC 15030 = ATCC 35035]|uniref:non-canonical purine NTP diphosphatase n=1 Tax=Flavobacterium branchiophilum TaxID=55197 RepID=UPI000B6B76FA|nr:non-canonical purine NTP diphosphatase [Flavobacterium branchiophilum]OXA72292.1 non-canonical purine NTP pyrophosphatase [Flavobacterium branchiophilum NBRC 15030 = ATCC 35035]
MKLVFASNNAHKIEEIQQLVPEFVEILSLQAINCLEDIPETATTIAGNAQLKANYVTEKYGYPCFADDTGLEIEALNGAPGVFSARYAGEPKNDKANLEKVLENMTQETHRAAQFKTVICLNLNGLQHLFTGIVKGNIALTPKGNQGFGYDPIFRAAGYDKTFAEMTMKEKSEISHRGKAVEQLVVFLRKM